MTVLLVRSARAQLQGPTSVSQVLGYSAVTSKVPYQGGTIPSIFTETLSPIQVGSASFKPTIFTASNYTTSKSLFDLESAINAGIATALSIVPLSSPASGVILRTDPKTEAELPESSTLGTIFTERAETIGKHRWYVGFSHQDFHFSRFNGMDLNSLSVLYRGGDPSAISLQGGGPVINTVPATFQIGMNVHLSQDITFITFGLTDRVDVSVGLPVVHAGVLAETHDGVIYAGTGFANDSHSTCWCVNTFTPGTPTLELPGTIGQDALSRTGFGDVLVRLKGSVIRKRNVVVAVGSDLRLPTGSAANYLGTGTTSVKPFTAVSLYSKPVRKVVFSPHFDLGWQFSGKSILGGELQPTETAYTIPYTVQGVTNQAQFQLPTGPFASTKGFIPDVFSWAAGTEVALGHRNTVILDILGDQIGWIHGIPDVVSNDVPGVYLPEGVNGNSSKTPPPPAMGTAAGLVGVYSSPGILRRVAFGQYNGSLGYKARIAGNLVANISILYRFDNNGLVARVVPSYGLSYTFH